MNGVLCAGNKDKTNYVIIQLLLICHSQIKCQIKVRGALCLFNGLQATCSYCWQTTIVQVVNVEGSETPCIEFSISFLVFFPRGGGERRRRGENGSPASINASFNYIAIIPLSPLRKVGLDYMVQKEIAENNNFKTASLLRICKNLVAVSSLPFSGQAHSSSC